jgi:hypothetical protein
MLRTYLALAGALLVLGSPLASCAVVKHIDADRDKWRTEAKAFKHRLGEYDKALRLSERYRAEEAKSAQDDLYRIRQACDADIEAVRKAEAAKRAIHAKPVPMKDGCPIREMIAASELGLK